MRYWLAIILIFAASSLWAQPNTPVRMYEDFAKDAQYHVTCEVKIDGTLTIAAGGKDARPLKVAGKSSIKYDERILKLDANRKAERTVRYYRQLEFERKVGDEEQHSKLRPEAARLVILRHNQYEVPFCPSGPLTWGEIELVRTDVFSPALAGLLPLDPVSVGQSWKANSTAVQELTDVEKIDKADFVCTLDRVGMFNGRKIAYVSFKGKVHGISEDGNAFHDLIGSYSFDLDANFLGYISVNGTHHLLDKNGKATGKIEGTFVMTRDRTPVTNEVGDNALRGLTLEPNADNSLLLFEHPQVAARFVYPRNWRVAGFNMKKNPAGFNVEEIGVDETRGSGVLLTVTPANATPNGAQFLQQTREWLVSQKATVYSESKVLTLPGGTEMFAFDADVAKQRVNLQYYVMRQGNLGVTVTARLLPGDLANTQRDVERMAKSLQLRATK